MDSFLIPTYQIFKEEIEELEIKSETAVLDELNRYKNLPRQALYTSFEDLEKIFQHPAVKGSWVDIGGGSGRSALLYSFLKHRPAVNIEIDQSRARVGEVLSAKYRLLFTSVVDDLMKCALPEGDTYFLYFPTGPVLDRILDILSNRIDFTLVVIESHGDLLNRIEKEEGYELTGTIPLLTPRHLPDAYIFRKVRIPFPFWGPHQLSFREELLVFEDEQGEWVGDSLGLEWLGEDRYQLLHPPRTVSWTINFKRMMEEENPDYQFLKKISELRKLGEVKFLLKEGREISGVIRKIRMSGPLRLEISTSELIEWQSILKIIKGSHLCYDFSSSSFSLPAH